MTSLQLIFTRLRQLDQLHQSIWLQDQFRYGRDLLYRDSINMLLVSGRLLPDPCPHTGTHFRSLTQYQLPDCRFSRSRVN